MPAKIRMADYGDFVFSPDASVDEKWIEYIKMADRLIEECRKAQSRCRQSPFSAELARRKQTLEGYLGEYTALYRDKYTIRPVERDLRFLHVSEFFAEYHPVRETFSVLHCSLDLPLHTIREFQTLDELDRLNAALAENTPLRWWRSGPMDRPCYLFGQWVWELKPSEVVASKDGLALMFSETVEKGRHRQDRLTHSQSCCSPGPVATLETLPKEVRVAVWRRDKGKCVKCGSYRQIDFHYIVPPDRGGSDSPDNVQLLCEKCRRVKLGDPSTP